MTAADWIAKRREIDQAATEGPWSATYGPNELPRIWSDATAYSDAEFIAECAMKDDVPDALFIADARNSLPRALDALEKVLGKVQPLQRVAATDGAVDEHDYVGELADEIEQLITEALGVE